MSIARGQTVAITRSDGDVEAAVRSAISLAGGLSDLAGKQVAIKPNLVCPAASGSGQITDSRVMAAVARVALEAGARVKFVEGAAVGFIGTTDQNDTFEAAEVSGLSAVADELGIELVDLNRDAYDEVPVPGYYGMPTVPLPRALAQAEFIISVPVFKTHGFSGLTLACKNFQGIMPWRNKRRTHRVGLEAGLSDIYSVVKPGFAVVDCITAQNNGDRVSPNLIFAGRDCVAVDATCTRAVGTPPDRLGLLRFCAERGLGTTEADAIEVKGLSLASAAEILGSPWAWAPNQPIEATPEVEWLIPDAFPCCAYTYGINVALTYVKTIYGSEPLKGLRVALGDGPVQTPRTKVDLVVGDGAARWATGTSEVISRSPVPALVASEVCRLRGLDVASIAAWRKRIPDSDWPEIK